MIPLAPNILLFHLFLANSLSEKEDEVFVWNRTVNNHGDLENNIPHDLEVEHSNNFNKQGFNNLGVRKQSILFKRTGMPSNEIKLFKTELF